MAEIPMGTWRQEPESGGLAASFAKVAEGLAKLLTELITLARMELAEDAKRVGREIGLVAAFVPFALIGYTFLCLSLTFALSRWMSMSAAFAWVGGVHLGIAAIGIAVVFRGMRTRPLMDDTVAELSQSTRLLDGTPSTPDRPRSTSHGNS